MISSECKDITQRCVQFVLVENELILRMSESDLLATPTLIYPPSHPVGELTPGQVDFIRLLSFSGSLISVIGSAFIVTTFAFSGRLKQTDFLRQVFILSLADIISDVPAFFSSESAGTSCAFSGFLMQFLDLIPVLWTTVISFHLYTCIYRAHAMTSPDAPLYQRWWHYFLFAVGVPLLLAMVPFVLGEYGWTGAFCWVRSRALGFLIFFVPVLIAVVTNAVIYRRLTEAFERTFSAHTSARAMSRYRRMLIYPFLLVIVWGPIFVLRALNLFVSPSTLLPLYVVAIPLSRAQGALNAVVYGADTELLAAIADSFRALLGRKVAANPYDVRPSVRCTTTTTPSTTAMLYSPTPDP